MEDFQTNERIRYERAQKRVKSLSGFYRHLGVYIIVNVVLISIKAVRLDPGESFWSFNTFSTAFFWGIGLAFHAFGVFYNTVFFGKEWEERKINEMMNKDRNRKWE